MTARDVGATEDQLRQIAADGKGWRMCFRANNTRAYGLGVEAWAAGDAGALGEPWISGQYQLGH